MILNILCFLLGVHLSMMLVASCYRLIDLWYRITDFIFSILARIAALLALNAIFILWLQGTNQVALIGGQLFFLLFHVTVFWAGRILIIFLTRH
jgi:hypothetical protein